MIQTGVPNQGTGAPFAFLNNDFSIKSASRLLAKILNDAYTLHIDDTNSLTVKNPDGSDLNAASSVEFIAKYIETFKDLLATYNFIDDIEDSEETLRALTTSDSVFNTLLTDLNAYDLDAFVARGQLDIVKDELSSAFIVADNGDGVVTYDELVSYYDVNDGVLNTSEATALAAADTGDDLGGAADGILSYAELLRFYSKQTYIVYSDQKETADIAVKHTGPDLSLGTENEILPFDNTLIGTLPGVDQVWYEIKNHTTKGDGTVSTFSSSTGFVDSRLAEVSSLAGEVVGHSGIVHNEVSQRKIVELLGVTDHTAATISTDLLLTKPQSIVRLIEIGVLDPLELASDLYTETTAKINGLIDSANALLDQKLPIINLSLSELIGANLPTLNLDGFINGLTSAVAIPSGASLQEQLTNFETSIEGALGLVDSELAFNSLSDITTTGAIVLSFNVNRTESTLFYLDFSASGPLRGDLVEVMLDAGISLQFNITLNMSDLTALAGGELGANGLTFELVDFNIYGQLSATNINSELGYEGLGSLSVTNGSILFRGEMDIAFYDPEQVRLGIPNPTLDLDQTLTFSDLISAGDTPLSLLYFDTSASDFTFDLPIIINADNIFVDFNGAGKLIINTADIFSGEIDSFGVSLGTTDSPAEISIDDFIYFNGIISVEYRIDNLRLSDNTLRENVGFSIISATGVTAFIGSQGSTGLSVDTLDFTLLMFEDLASTFSYTSLNTSALSATLTGTNGLSITVNSLTVELNQTSNSVEPGLVIDFDDTGLASGIAITPLSGPTLNFDGESGSLLNVSGSGSLNLSDLILISGNFGFAKVALDSTHDQLQIVANSITASVTLENTLAAEIENGSFALVINETDTVNTVALVASGTPSLNSNITGFSDLSVGFVTVTYNDTGTDYSGVNALVLDINGVTGTIDVADNERSVSLQGLQAEYSDFVSIAGDFAFRSTGTGVIEAVADNVDARLSLFTFEAGVSSGTLALRINADGNQALEATGTLVLSGAGFTSVTATDVRVQYNSTTTDYSALTPAEQLISISGVSESLTMGAGSADIPFVGVAVTISSASITGIGDVSGKYSFQRGLTNNGSSVVKVFVEDASVALGNDTTTLIAVTGATGGLLITDQGIAAQLDANINFTLGAGLTVDAGTFRLAFNNTSDAIDETFSIGSESYSINVQAGPFIKVEANDASLTLLGVTLTGNVYFEQTENSAAEKTIIIGLSNIAFTYEESAASAFNVTNARGVLVILADGYAGSLSFTVDVATGSFGANASAKIEFNSSLSAIAIDEAFGSFHIEAGPDLIRVVTDISISFGDNIFIEGTFSVATATGASANLTAIIGTNVNIFVGDGATELPLSSDPNAVGLLLTGGRAIILQDGDKEAAYITGRVQLLGIDGVVLDTTMTLRVNEFTSTDFATGLSESFTVNGEAENIDFTVDEMAVAAEPFIQIGATDVRLSIESAIALRGNFTITRGLLNTENRTGFLIGATNVQAFVGQGSAWLADGNINPDATGFMVSNLNLGLVVYTADSSGTATAGKFALVANGNVALQGLAEVELSGTNFEINVNRSGLVVTENVPVIGSVAGVDINFTSATDLTQFKGTVEITIQGIVKAAGTLDITRQTGVAINDGITDENIDDFLGNVLTASLTNAYLFVGTGTVEFDRDTDSSIIGFITGNDAIGFKTTNAAFDLVIISETTSTLRDWVGVSAHIGNMTVVNPSTSYGLAVKKLDILYNIAANDGSKLNWDELTSIGSINGFENMDELLDLKVSGVLELSIDSYIKAAGSFDITQQDLVDVNDGTVSAFDASLLALNLSNVHIFVGSGAGEFSYLSEQEIVFDTNGDGAITVAELRALNGNNSYSSVVRTLYQADSSSDDTLVVDDVIRLLDENSDGILSVFEVQNFLSADNDAMATAVDSNEDGNLELGELQALLNTTGDRISIGKLRSLNGIYGSYSSTVGSLYEAASLTDDVITLELLVQILDIDIDGILTVEEAQNFLSSANDEQAISADIDENSVLDLTEQQALFDSENDGITVGELRVLAGNIGSYSSAARSLYQVGSLDTDIVEIDKLVRILDENGDGLLTVEEMQGFLSVDNDVLALNADLNGDNQLNHNDEGLVTAIDTTNAIGFIASGANLNLAIIGEKAATPRTWIAVASYIDNISVVGIDEFTLTVKNLDILFNLKAGDNSKLNWANLTNNGTVSGFEGIDTTLNLNVSGALELSIDSYVKAAASFEIQQSDITSPFNASLLQIEMTNVHLFIGAGAGDFIYDANGLLTGIDTSNATGFVASGVNLNLAIISETTADPLSWVAISAQIGAMSVVGIDNFTLNVRNLDLILNVANSNGTRLNWSALSIIGFEDITESITISVSGVLELAIDSYVKATGSFEIIKESNVAIDDGVTAPDVANFNADVLKINLSGVYLFVGSGAGDFTYDDGTGLVNGLDTTNATGFEIIGASLSVTVISETTGTQPRSWIGIAAHIGSMSVLPATSNYTLTVKNLDLLYNVASHDGRKLNWDDLTSDGVVSDYQGMDETLDLKVSGAIELDINGFVKAAGQFEISQQSNLSIDDGTISISDAELLMINISGVHLFVGVGAGDFSYDATTDLVNGIDTTNAVGFKTSGASLNLAIISETTGDLRSWSAVSVNVDYMSVVGISDFTLTVKNLNVLYNVADKGLTAAPSDDTKLNWSILTSNGSVSGFEKLDTSLNLQVSGALELAVDSYVKAAGQFEITQSNIATLDDGSISLVNASLLSVNLTQVYVFVGTGAGAFSYDTNGLVTGIDTGNATGFETSGASLSLAIIRETTGDLRSWTAISAHIDSMSVVGVSGLTLSVSKLDLLSNVAASFDGSRLNWHDLTQDDVVSEYLGLTTALTIQVSGVLELSIDTYVKAAGNFEITQQTNQTINDGSVSLTNAELLTLNLSGVYLFVGANAGTFTYDGTGSVTGINTTDATIGFSASGASLELMIVRETSVTERSWMALAAHVDAMTIHGLTNSFEFEINALNVLYNGADKVAGDRLDWSAISQSSTQIANITDTTDISVSGQLYLNVSGFIMLSQTSLSPMNLELQLMMALSA